MGIEQRVARRFRAGQSLREVAVDLRQVEKLRAKLRRIEQKVAPASYLNWPDADEPVARKALDQVKKVGQEIGERLHRAFDAVEQFVETTQTDQPQARHNLGTLRKRLDHEKPWLDKWDDLVRDPIHFSTSGVSYGSAMGNAFGHFWIDSRERYTALRAMVTIALATSDILGGARRSSWASSSE